MTAGVVRDLLSDHCQPADLRRLMAEGRARDPNRWARIVEMGLAGALVPDEAGGLGLQPVDFILAAEACGYSCLPEPLVENTGVALPLLADAAPRCAVLADALANTLDRGETVAVGHAINPLVADADTAAALLLERDGALHLVEPAKARITAQASIDPFRRLFAVEFDAGGDTLVADAATARPLLDATLDRGALFAAAQLLGIAQRCVDLAVDYARQRHQFGKPIGSYQAVKHMLATAQVRIEFARPVLHAAAAMLPQFDRYSRARISQAKLAACEAADLSTRTAVQVHGAMGYSWEVDVHFFLKRALALESWWGTPAFHRERVARRVLGGRLGPEHTFAREATNA